MSSEVVKESDPLKMQILLPLRGTINYVLSEVVKESDPLKMVSAESFSIFAFMNLL